MRHRSPHLAAGRSNSARRATAVAVTLSFLAASGVAVVIGTSHASAPVNLLTNPGFETNLAGWTPLTKPLHLARVLAGHSGSAAAQLSADSSSTVVLKDTPNTVVATAKGGRTTSAFASASTRSMEESCRGNGVATGRPAPRDRVART